MDRWILISGILVLAFVGVPYIAEHYSVADERREPVRVEQFDKEGQRTGYAVIDTKTGRVDYFDARSRRVGSGKIQNIQPRLEELTKPEKEKR